MTDFEKNLKKAAADYIGETYRAAEEKPSDCSPGLDARVRDLLAPRERKGYYPMTRKKK